MAAPQYSFTNYFGTSDPAGDILTLIETQLSNTEWVFVEQVAFTQASTARVMRVWKCPATLNAAGADFYVGLCKNAVAGTYLVFRVFEGWNTTTKTMQRPCLTGAAGLNANWSAVAYGNSTFVAVANSAGGTYSFGATSTDGATWTPRLMPTTATTWTGVAYGNSTFVAVASGTNIVATSPDGITWTSRTTLPTSTTWQTITYTGTTFVALATGTSISATSPDGITWTQRALPSSGPWSSAAAGGGVVVAIGNGMAARSTNDGASWTTATTLPSTGVLSSVAYGNGVFVATGGSSGSASSSPTGVTWTDRALPANQVWGPVVFGNGTFVTTTGSGAGVAATSTDGTTWVSRTTAQVSVTAGAYGTTFTFVGPTNPAAAGAYTTPDGTTWTIGKGIATATTIGLGDYAPSGATVPALCEGGLTLIVTTNYDVGILVSKSYLAVGINLNGTSTVRTARVMGLFAPAYSDPVSTNLPLMNLDLNGSAQTTTGGVSRSMRAPIDANGTSTFGIGAGPESLLVGNFTAAAKDPVTNSIRGSRVALVASSANVTGYSATGGMRGWLYDCTAVAVVNGMKVFDTVTIGSTVWTGLSWSTSGGTNTSIANNPVGYFFNLATGS